MGIEDFFLGGVSGATGALADVQLEKIGQRLALERQISLMDVTNRIQSQSRRAELQRIFNSLSEEDREAAGIDDIADVERLTSPAGQAVEQRISATRTAEQEQAQAEAAAQQVSELFGGDLSPEQVTGARELGVLPQVLERIEKGQTSKLTPEQVGQIPTFQGQDRATLEFLANTEQGQRVIENALTDKFRSPKEGQPSVVTIRRRSDGQLIEIPESKLLTMLDKTDAEGNKLFTTADRRIDEGQAFAVTIDGVFPIGEQDGGANLPPFAAEVNLIKNRLRQSPEATRGGFSFANPLEIDTDINFDNARGPFDQLKRISQSGAPTRPVVEFFFGEGAGQPPAKTAKVLSLIQEQSRRMAGVVTEGKKLSAELPLADQFSATTNPVLAALLSESDVEIALQAGRRRAQVIRATAESTLESREANSNAKSKARQIINVTDEILGTIDSFIASDELSNLVIPNLQGVPDRITNILDTSDKAISFIRSQQFAQLTPREQQLILLWRASLLTQGR